MRMRDVVRWAVGWMRRHYARDFRVCMALILYCAVYVALRPLLLDHLFSNVLVRNDEGHPCTPDIAFLGCMLLGGSLLMVCACPCPMPLPAPVPMPTPVYLLSHDARTTRARARARARACRWRPSTASR